MRIRRVVSAACLVLSCLTASIAEPAPFVPQVLSDPYPGIPYPNANYDVIGSLSGFDIESVTLTQFSNSTVSLEISFNYGPANNYSRPDPLAPYNFFGAQLQVGDLLFGRTPPPGQEPVYTYGVALIAHDGFDAGDLYRIKATRDSDFYLGAFSGSLFWNYDTPVRMDPLDSEHLSAGTAVTTKPGAPRLLTTITFDQHPDFQDDWNDTGLSVHFTSGICANDELNGGIGPAQVPEPASFLLLVAGLGGLAAVRHRARSRKMGAAQP